MLAFLHKHLIIISILILALGLRLPFLNGSFWMDEAAQALESTRPFSQQLQIAYDFQPPLFHLIVHFWSYVSYNEAWLRSTSLIAGLITVWATFQLGKKLYNQQVGIVASILLSLSSFHIFFSQELRPYSLAAMWGMLSWVVLLNWKMGKLENGRGLSNFPIVQFSVLTLAGLYSMYLYPFLLLSQIVYVFLLKRSIFTQFLVSTALACLGFLPWLPSFLEQLHVGGQLRQNTQGWDQVVSLPQFKALPLTIGKFIYGIVDLDLNLFFGISSMALLLGFGYLLFKKGSRLRSLIIDHRSFALMFFLPLLTAWLISFVVPVVQPKRVLFLLPILFIFLGAIIVDALASKRVMNKRVAQFVLGLLLTIQISGTAQYYLEPKYQRENWREAIQVINENHSTHNTVVVFGFNEPFSPWLWYQDVQFKTILTGTNTVTEISQIEEEMNTALDHEHVIVFDYLRDLTDPNRTIEQWLSQYNYQQGTLYDYPNIGFIRVFNRSKQYAEVGVRP